MRVGASAADGGQATARSDTAAGSDGPCPAQLGELLERGSAAEAPGAARLDAAAFVPTVIGV